MEFEEQIINTELVIDKTPRVYIKWRNIEVGRDKTDCYERVSSVGGIIYINCNNRNGFIHKDHPFWEKLEKLYTELSTAENKEYKNSEKREKDWMKIYEKCKNITDSPSMTKAVIKWFIENKYDAPNQSE